MEKFELKIDLNTPYIRVIRFVGTLLLGFFIAMIILKFKYEGTVDWMSAPPGIIFSIIFAFFPGAAKKQALTIDEEGIHLHHYTFHWGQKKEIRWEKVKAVGVQKNKIEIKNSIGISEKIQLPLHTKEQLEELRAYLPRIAKVKEIEYLN